MPSCLHCHSAQVLDGAPSTVDEDQGLEEDAAAGVVQHEALAINQRPLQLQLLQVGRGFDT